MQELFQLLMLLMWFMNLILLIYFDVNGRKAKEPAGFGGIVSSIIASAFTFWIYYNAGAFNKIFKIIQ